MPGLATNVARPGIDHYFFAVAVAAGGAVAEGAAWAVGLPTADRGEAAAVGEVGTERVGDPGAAGVPEAAGVAVADVAGAGVPEAADAGLPTLWLRLWLPSALFTTTNTCWLLEAGCCALSTVIRLSVAEISSVGGSSSGVIRPAGSMMLGSNKILPT